MVQLPGLWHSYSLRHGQESGHGGRREKGQPQLQIQGHQGGMSWRLEIRTEVWAQDIDLELTGDRMASEGPRRGSPECMTEGASDMVVFVEDCL